MRIPFMKQVAWYLVFAMFIIGIAPRVDAGLAPSEAIALAQVDRIRRVQALSGIIGRKELVGGLSRLL